MGRIQDAMRRAASDEVSARTETPPAPPGGGETFQVEGAAPAGESTSFEPDVAGDLPLAAVPADEPPGDPADTDTADAVLSHLGPGLAAKVVVDGSMAPVPREQYRRLAAVLHHAQEANGLKVVMIASAAAGEGKSLTAANLALTLSESYRRTVLLVDGDLRRPSLHTLFGITPESGLSEALDAPDEPKLTLYDLSPTLTLLPENQAAMPEISPPPPTATSTVSRSGSWLCHSRPSVPWPAIVSFAEKGWIFSAPVSATNLSQAACASSYCAPPIRTSAPKRRIASILAAGEISGTKIVAFTPRLPAA